MLTFLMAGYTPLARARKALSWALVFTGILLIPLGASFVELVRQAQLQGSLKRALLNQTFTFQRVELIKSDVNWLSDPPQVRLTVRTSEVVTPKQVRLLEEFVEKEMGQRFTLIFEVSQIEKVRRENPPFEPKP